MPMEMLSAFGLAAGALLLAVWLAAVAWTAVVVRKRQASGLPEALQQIYRVARRWSREGARAARKARARSHAFLRELLRWSPLGVVAGGAWALHEFGLSVLSIAGATLALTAAAGALFAIRRAQRARSYTRSGTQQQRRASRHRAAQRRASRRRRRQQRQQQADYDRPPRNSSAPHAAPSHLPRRVLDALDTLGLPPEGASRAQIQAAYRREAMKHHPDRHAQGSQAVQLHQKERFQAVQQARATLERYYA